jgi:ribosomal-protein-alanine N-acetyltransferase
MNLAITDRIALTEIKSADQGRLIEHLNDQEIYANTLRIPSPYTDADANRFLAVVGAAITEHSEPVHFAIRDSEAGLIGGCGFDGLVRGHRAELGYWLARPWRRQGIMTATIGTVRDYALARWDLVRISAHVFTFNIASVRILEKNGFTCEEVHRKQFLKDGQYIDALTYAFVS